MPLYQHEVMTGVIWPIDDREIDTPRGMNRMYFPD